MTALVTLNGNAASLLLSDINTDTIAPLVRSNQGLQPAGIRSNTELAQRLFGPWRYTPDGQENPDFVRGGRRSSRKNKKMINKKIIDKRVNKNITKKRISRNKTNKIKY